MISDLATQTVDPLGRPLHAVLADAGESRAFPDVANTPLLTWSARGVRHRRAYDELRRPTHLWVLPPTPPRSPEWLAERTVYGESLPDADARTANARGKAIRVFDGAGAVRSPAYDFKGNPLATTRQLATLYRDDLDWSPLASLTDVAALDAAAAPQLDPTDVFTTTVTYDALNRVTSKTTPDASVTLPTYNEANLLERLDVRLRGADTSSSFVTDLDYNARGQRERIAYGNGTTTTYAYDPLSFRLARLRTVRDSGGFVLQDLQYTYDAVGNIVQISDAVSFGNASVSADGHYEYDATYQLTRATGREHPGQQPTDADPELLRLDHPEDLQALRRYREDYTYDPAGNITAMAHVPLDGASGWTRRYSYATDSNRLLATSLPGDDPTTYSATYTHDVHGNMTSMPHLAEMRWDHADRFRYADRAGGGDVYFVYDASGQRVRKAYEHGGLLEERLYLGDFELYRRRNLATGDIAFARETLHVMSDHSRVALAETLIVDVEFPGFTLYARFRYQLESHLKSIVLEVDETGTIITYEEYLPFGGNAFRAGASMLERPPKTYRYCGLERDNETGLSYAAARYLSSWLARWTAADPLGTQGGTNQYCYCGNNPTCRSDPNGTDWGWDSINPWKIAKGAAKAAYHMVVDTGERAVDITTQSASALGHATGWYDIGYTEWSPESQRIRATLDENQQATTWSLIREGVYNNTVGGTVNMAKGIASGDPDAIGAGFLVLGLSMAGGGNNPRFNLPVPVFQMARAPGLDVAIPVLRSRRSPLPYLRRKLSLQHRSARG